MWPMRLGAFGHSALTCAPAWKTRRALKPTSSSRRASRRFMASTVAASTQTPRRDPDSRGYFGEFGGRFVPETLVEPVEELERAYLAARDDQEFQRELDRWLTH